MLVACGGMPFKMAVCASNNLLFRTRSSNNEQRSDLNNYGRGIDTCGLLGCGFAGYSCDFCIRLGSQRTVAEILESASLLLLTHELKTCLWQNFGK